MADLYQDIRQARYALLECYDEPDHKARVTRAFDRLTPQTVEELAQSSADLWHILMYRPTDPGYMAEDPVHWELFVRPDVSTIWRNLELDPRSAQTPPGFNLHAGWLQGETITDHPNFSDEDVCLKIRYRDNRLWFSRLTKQEMVLERAVNGLDGDPDRENITREFRFLLQSLDWREKIDQCFASYRRNMQRGAVFIAMATELWCLPPALKQRVYWFYEHCYWEAIKEPLAAALAANAKFLPPEIRTLPGVKLQYAIHQLSAHRYANLPDATKAEITQTYFETNLTDKIRLMRMLASQYPDLGDDLQQDAYIVLMIARTGVDLHPNVPRDFVIARLRNEPVAADPLHNGDAYRRFAERWRKEVIPLARTSRREPSPDNTANVLQALQDLRDTVESPERPVPPHNAQRRRGAKKRLDFGAAFADLVI